MDAENLYETNLNTVKEMILDEEKLVTYITLSKDLCLHVNNSKQLLYNVVQKIRKEQANIQLNITYLISGLTSSNTATTTLCTETDLKKVKKLLQVVFFYHIYGVCKGSPGVDNAAFLLLHKYEDYTLCAGLIRSKDCIKWTSDEIGNLKTNSQEAIILENKLSVVANKNENKQKPVFAAQTNGHVEEAKPVKQIEMKSAETKTNVDITSPKKESNNKQNAHKTNGLKAQKGIASFFNKSNSLKSQVSNTLQKKKFTDEVENLKPSNESLDSKLDNEKMDVDDENIEVKAKIKQEIIREKKDSKEKKKESKEEKIVVKKEPVSAEKNKASNKIKKSKVDKKRKRVLHVSDSEDDDDLVNDGQNINNEEKYESDEEIPSTPLTNNIKITSGFVHPRKRRKVVDKTYTDEDGYILTKKEEVYESCSENEDEIKIEKEIKVEKELRKADPEISSNETKKNSPKKSKKKISPPQKGKQPTLNSFFRKK